VLPNPKRELRPGMFVTANVKGGTRPNAVIVPQLAVQQGAKGHVVYVVKEDGTAEVRPVVVGDYSGEKGILIASGLQAGDKVVVEGALRVVPGQPVKIGEPTAAGTEAAGAKSAKSGEAAKK
jgi:membrane fusion protein (multidrug efflux system)